MKAGWQVKTLGEVCEIVNGGTPKTGVVEYWGNEHLWITPAEMGKRSNPYVTETERKITSQGLKNSSARLLPPNSVILSSRAPIGHLVINTKPMATNQGCKGLVPNENLAYKYLFYFLQANVDLLNDLGSGATFKELSGGKLKEVKIPLAPLAEQQRIIAILDQAFEGIAKVRANAEQNLQNARALFESHLQSTLTNNVDDWKVGILGEVCEELFAGGDVPKDNSSKIKSEKFNIPIFSNGEKNKGLYGFTNVPRVTKPSITVSARGTIGYSEIRYESFYPAIRLIVVTPKTDVLDLFFLKYLISNMDFIHSGTSIPQLTVPMIKEYPIKFPTIEVQKRIIKNLDELSAETQLLEALHQRKIELLDELKKSLLQQAFAGEL